MSDPFESIPSSSLPAYVGTPTTKVLPLSPTRHAPKRMTGGAFVSSPPMVPPGTHALPSVRYPTTAGNPTDAKLREVVCALNEVATARKNEAGALQRQLDNLSVEYRKYVTFPFPFPFMFTHSGCAEKTRHCSRN